MRRSAKRAEGTTSLLDFDPESVPIESGSIMTVSGGEARNDWNVELKL